MNTGRICFTPLRVLNNYVHHYNLCKQFHGSVQAFFSWITCPFKNFWWTWIKCWIHWIKMTRFNCISKWRWWLWSMIKWSLFRNTFRQTIELDRQSNYMQSNYRPQASQSLFRIEFTQLRWTHQRYTARNYFCTNNIIIFMCITKHRHALRNQI